LSRDYIIQVNSVQNVGISLSLELRALRGVASVVTTGVHDTLDVHPAVYEIKNGFKIKLTNITNHNIYLRQGDRLATGEVFQAGSFDSVSELCNDEQKAAFANILSKHSDVFSIDTGDVGKCDIIKQQLP
jgi:hypothetical protein